jgi:hypothetical protein
MTVKYRRASTYHRYRLTTHRAPHYDEHKWRDRRRRGRTAFGPVIARSTITGDERVRLEQRTHRAGAHLVAYASLEIELNATRDVL